MGLACCDKCWERPCVCGHEAREAEAFRSEYFASIADLRQSASPAQLEFLENWQREAAKWGL